MATLKLHFRSWGEIMNYPILNREARRVACALALASAAYLPGPLHATVTTLTDNNSVASIDPTSQAGLFNWAVQGQNQMYQQWFWYRLGTGNQYSIDTISAPSIVTSGTRQLSATYAANNFTLSIDYLLSGGSVVAPGQNANSAISETVRIQNTSASALDFHFFNYTDFDLGGGGGSDTVQLGRNPLGLFNDAYQQNTLAGSAETVTTPGANRGEADFWNNTLTRLNTIANYNLNNASGPVGPGDVAWAFQWDLNIAPGGSAIISQANYLSVMVPEPSLLALLAVGGLTCLLRRRTT
jgi:hypothetical protein